MDDVVTKLIKKYNFKITFDKKKKTRPARRKKRPPAVRKDAVYVSDKGHRGTDKCAICGMSAKKYYLINKKDRTSHKERVTGNSVCLQCLYEIYSIAEPEGYSLYDVSQLMRRYMASTKVDESWGQYLEDHINELKKNACSKEGMKSIKRIFRKEKNNEN